MIGAILSGAATFCLLLALSPRPARVRLSPLALIKASTQDQPSPGLGSKAVAHRLLRRLTLRVGVGPRWTSRKDLVEAGLDPEMVTPAEIATLKLMLAGTGGLVGLVLAAVAPGALLAAPVLSWAGFLAPSVYLSRRRAARRAKVISELPGVIGLLRAFVNAHVSLEQALHLVATQLSVNAENLLARELRLAVGEYGLGETIEASLQAMADRLGSDEVRTLVAAIAQGRRLGTGMHEILRDQELLARLAQRNKSTAAAARVSTRLMGVLVAFYLPEFVLLIMLPLFWGVMQRAFG